MRRLHGCPLPNMGGLVGGGLLNFREEVPLYAPMATGQKPTMPRGYRHTVNFNVNRATG